jgi:NAD(P)-dependent dehydrogenase (short-subunit alcohol dehydrogenase family)
MASTSKIWFITGVSGGLGLALAKAVVAAGDMVVGSVRKSGQAEAFEAQFPGKAFAVHMDVTVAEEREAAMAQILRQHGRIDVLVNNAGYGLFGAIEEISEAEARAQMETNFFGALALTQAVLPIMRGQGSGHVVQISSIAGFASMPGLGIYNASKYALEGFSEALAQEVAAMGIRVTLVEPGPFRTQWAGDSAVRSARRIDAYAEGPHALINMIHGYSGNQPGDPDKAAKVILEAVRSDAPPVHLPLGKTAIDRMRAKMASLEKEIAAWEARSLATAFE